MTKIVVALLKFYMKTFIVYRYKIELQYFSTMNSKGTCHKFFLSTGMLEYSEQSC